MLSLCTAPEDTVSVGGGCLLICRPEAGKVSKYSPPGLVPFQNQQSVNSVLYIYCLCCHTIHSFSSFSYTTVYNTLLVFPDSKTFRAAMSLWTKALSERLCLACCYLSGGRNREVAGTANELPSLHNA